MEDYKNALKQLMQARQNLDYADPQFIDAAIYELKAAEVKLSISLMHKKKDHWAAATAK